MGNVPPCVLDINSLAPAPYELTWLRSCDYWAVTHLLLPFWITLLTRSFTYGLLFTHLGETAELLLQSVTGSYVLFPQANGDTESLAQVLEDLLQGAFASLLGAVFIWVYDGGGSGGVPLLRFSDLHPRNICRRGGRFLFYFVCLAIAFGPNVSILGINTDSGFPLGRVLYPIIMLFGLSLMVGAQWLGLAYPYANSEYWGVAIGFSLVISIQHIWDYLYSRHVQSWVYASALFFWLLFRKATL